MDGDPGATASGKRLGGRRAEMDGVRIRSGCVLVVLATIWAAEVRADGPGAMKLPGLSSSSARKGAEAPPRKPSLDERFLFQPARYPAGPWDQKPDCCEEIRFESSDGTPLNAWMVRADDPAAVVLYCHGNSGNISLYGRWMERVRERHRLTLMVFDYRGYGKSEGEATVEGVLADAAAARTKLATLAGCPEEKLLLWGRSLGGAVAIQLAAAKPPAGLILESTFPSFREVADLHQPALSWLVPRDRLNSVEAIGDVKCPLLQAHGTADRLIPLAMGKKLHEAAGSSTKRLLVKEGGDHNNGTPETFPGELDAFCAALKEGPRAPGGSPRRNGVSTP